VKDGAIGTLATGRKFFALTDDGANDVYGIVGEVPSFDWPCKSGCEAQRIDVATRMLVSKKTHSIPEYRRTVALRLDGGCKRLVLGHARPNPSDGTRDLGFRVLQLDY